VVVRGVIAQPPNTGYGYYTENTSGNLALYYTKYAYLVAKRIATATGQR